MWCKTKVTLAAILITILMPYKEADAFSFVTAKDKPTSAGKAESLSIITEARNKLQEAMDIHNTIFTLYDDIDIIDIFQKNVLKHLESLELVKVNEKCNVSDLGNIFKEPEEVWYGMDCNLACRENDYDKRGGITGLASEKYDEALKNYKIDFATATVDELKDYYRTPWRIGREILIDFYANPKKYGDVKTNFPLWSDQQSLYEQYKSCLSNPYYDYNEFGTPSRRADCGKSSGVKHPDALLTPLPPFTEIVYYEPYQKGASLFPYEGMPETWELFFRMQGGEKIYGEHTAIKENGEFGQIYNVYNQFGADGNLTNSQIKYNLARNRNDYAMCEGKSGCLSENRISKWLQLRKQEEMLRESSERAEVELPKMQEIISNDLAKIGFELENPLDIIKPDKFDEAIEALMAFKEDSLNEIEGLIDNIDKSIDPADKFEEVLMDRTNVVTSLFSALSQDTEAMVSVSDNIVDNVSEIEDKILKGLEDRMAALELSAALDAAELASRAAGFVTGCLSF